MMYPVWRVAEELRVSQADVLFVAQAELSDDDFDALNEELSTAGRAYIVTHFHGGQDLLIHPSSQ